MRNLKTVGMLMVAVCMMFAAVGVVGAAEMVDINTATKEELMQLDGVGDVYAQGIVAYRENVGLFQAPEDIMKVKGIGAATYEKNKDRITVSQAQEPMADSQ